MPDWFPLHAKHPSGQDSRCMAKTLGQVDSFHGGLMTGLRSIR